MGPQGFWNRNPSGNRFLRHARRGTPEGSLRIPGPPGRFPASYPQVGIQCALTRGRWEQALALFSIPAVSCSATQNEEEREGEDMSAAQVRQPGAGEATEMRQEAGAAMAMRQGARGATKTQIHARITHVGSEYCKAVTSGTCELCITDWSARIRDISFNLRTSSQAPRGRRPPRPSTSAGGTTSGRFASTPSTSPRPSPTSPSSSTWTA